MTPAFLAAAAAALLAASACAMPVIPGPASQAAQPAWLAALAANRSAWRASVAFTTDVYDNYLLWSPSLHIVPQSHIYDRFLYDPALGAADPAAGWTVDRFLDDLGDRYGGIDGVLLWGTYPNMGVDERSQFDLLEDVPGGLAALGAVVQQFNARGVRVGLPYNPCACLRETAAPSCRCPSAPAAPPAAAGPYVRPPPLSHHLPSPPPSPKGTLARRGATPRTRWCSRSWLPLLARPLQMATQCSIWTKTFGWPLWRRAARWRCSLKGGLP